MAQHSVASLFEAMIEQTRQRGGSPSVGNITDAAQAVSALVAAYDEVREAAVQAGMSIALARAIEKADAAIAEVTAQTAEA